MSKAKQQLSGVFTVVILSLDAYVLPMFTLGTCIFFLVFFFLDWPLSASAPHIPSWGQLFILLDHKAGL